MTSLLGLTLDAPVVKAQVSMGTIGGTISTADSESGNALILLITNPIGPKVEITSCVGERLTGWRSRSKERFLIPLHGLPYHFGEDGDCCLAWTQTLYLPSLEGLVRIVMRDSEGGEWPIEDTDTLLQIRDRLLRRR